jgi:hypothetical protein
MIQRLNCVYFTSLTSHTSKSKSSSQKLNLKTQWTIFGVTFNSKLPWSTQVSNQILKANCALHAMIIINNFFTKDELLTLQTANYYSILYYSSKIWHILSLYPHSKQHMLAASVNAWRPCDVSNIHTLSYVDFYRTNKGPALTQMSTYKRAFLLI